MFNVDDKLAKVESGSWSDFQGSKFLIAHITNMHFQRTLARLQQPHRKRIDAGTMDPKQSKELLCKAMSEALLLDWQDVVDGSGKIVSFSPELAYKALMNNPEFREFVSEFATNLQNYREAELEEMGKSSTVG